MLINPESVVSSGKLALPEGYAYAESGSITADQLEGIDAAVNGPFDSPYQRAVWPDTTQFGITHFRFSVGVRPVNDERLVGIGYLFVRDAAPSRSDKSQVSAELGYLMVHPDHRERGIGTVILLERLRIADELKASIVTIDRLNETNTLRHKYFSLGFVQSISSKRLRRTANQQ